MLFKFFNILQDIDYYTYHKDMCTMLQQILLLWVLVSLRDEFPERFKAASDALDICYEALMLSCFLLSVNVWMFR